MLENLRLCGGLVLSLKFLSVNALLRESILRVQYCNVKMFAGRNAKYLLRVLPSARGNGRKKDLGALGG